LNKDLLFAVATDNVDPDCMVLLGMLAFISEIYVAGSLQREVRSR